MRSAYANAPGHTEEALRDLLKARYAAGPSEPCAVDAWILHSATREGIKLRNQRPDGRMVFGGRKNLERRRKGLISAGDWRALRQRPLLSLGDKGFAGNRHCRLAPDARTCTMRIYGTAVTLNLPEMRGNRGVLLRAVAAPAAAGEINVEFRLGEKSLSAVFDPQDLRRLPAGVSLQQDDDARLAAKGHKARGRQRGEGYKPPPFRWAKVPRRVHREWAPAVGALPGRVLAVDLNPDWIGLTVVENCGDLRSLAATTVLDHRLVKLDLPRNAPRELVAETLSKVAGLALSLCDRHGAALIGLEEGLGKLRSRTKARALNHRLNAWDRSTLLAMLTRRGGLRGVEVKVSAAYSTTIGNMSFKLPDACASAAESGRRTLIEMDWRARRAAARRNGSLPKGGVDKDLLPFLSPEALPTRWKDEAARGGRSRTSATGRDVGQAHREVKAAKLGVRRPHPDVASGADGPAGMPGFAVSRLGHRRQPGLVLRALSRNRDQPGRPVAANSRKAVGSP